MTVWPILLASVIGSPHCAAMCGVVAGAAGRTRAAGLGYHGARLAGYLALGIVAGALGLGADRLGAWAGLTGIATRLAGGVLVLAGVLGVLRALGLRRSGAPGIHQWVASVASRGRDLGPAPRAILLGLVTALLPCGWLYPFVAVAGGTGRAASGALVMAVFWTGTVPALASAGAVLQRLSGPLRAHLPLLSSATLIIFGLVTAFDRPHPHGETRHPTIHAHRID